MGLPEKGRRINMWVSLLLTLAVAAVCGYALFKLKVPGGMIVGGLIGVSVLGICFSKAYLPTQAKTLTQILAGAYIASTVKNEDLKHMPRIIKPYLLLVFGYMLLNLVMGLLVKLAAPQMSLLTAFMCCVPGGMTDIPIIAADMGADVTKVAALQFVRLIFGLGLFPSLISSSLNKARDKSGAKPKAKAKRTGAALQIAITLAIAVACGLAGKLTGIPAGTILFTIIGVLVYKLLGGDAFIPLWMRRIAQVLTGAYIGTCFTYQSCLELGMLWLPAVILAVGYSANCLLMGKLVPKLTHLNKAESMLIATPAGASDMALISADMGITNPEVSVILVMRMISVVSVFPHVILLFISLFGGLF